MPLIDAQPRDLEAQAEINRSAIYVKRKKVPTSPCYSASPVNNGNIAHV